MGLTKNVAQALLRESKPDQTIGSQRVGSVYLEIYTNQETIFGEDRKNERSPLCEFARPLPVTPDVRHGGNLSLLSVVLLLIITIITIIIIAIIMEVTIFLISS